MGYPGSASLNQALAAEQGGLLRLRLPVPQLVRLPLTRGQPLPDPASRFTYQIPPHAAFTFTPPDGGQPVCYFIQGDADLLAEAESDFAAYGLCAVAYRYPGLWLNRDPYLAYKAIQDKRRVPGAGELPPLKKVAGLPVSRLQALEAQAELFAGLTEGCLESASPFDLGYPLWPLAPDISLPRLGSRRELITVRLMHSPQTRPVTSRHFLEQLRGLKQPLTFSLVVEHNAACFQLSFAPEDQAAVERQLHLYFPTITVNPVTGNPPFTNGHARLYSSVCRPRYAYLLLRTDLHLNPYSQVLAALPADQPDHRLSVEVIFQPVSQSVVTRISDQLDSFRKRLQEYAEHKAAEAARYRKENEQYFGEWPRWSNDKKDYEERWDDYMDWLHSYDKKVGEVKRHHEELLAENPPLVQRAKDQMGKLTERIGVLRKKLPAWLASVRITSDSRGLTEQVERSFLRQFETLEQRWRRAPSRAFSRPPEWPPKMGLVNTDELAALVSFPSSALRDSRLETAATVTTVPPSLYTQSGISLGQTQALGASYGVTMPDQVRDRHVYVIGRTRSGKSTLLFNMILQDILRGAGVGVIDPHGDLVQKLLEYIPESRISDVIYLNPTDEQYPVPLNILNATTRENIGVLADDLIITFRRLSDSWGERMDSVLRSVVYTLLRTPGATFFDIQRILRDADYRKAVTRDLDFAPLREFWEYDFPQMPKDASQPILHRMSKFALFPTLHAMLSQPTSP